MGPFSTTRTPEHENPPRCSCISQLNLRVTQHLFPPKGTRPSPASPAGYLAARGSRPPQGRSCRRAGRARACPAGNLGAQKREVRRWPAAGAGGGGTGQPGGAAAFTCSSEDARGAQRQMLEGLGKGTSEQGPLSAAPLSRPPGESWGGTGTGSLEARREQAQAEEPLPRQVSSPQAGPGPLPAVPRDPPPLWKALRLLPVTATAPT